MNENTKRNLEKFERDNSNFNELHNNQKNFYKGVLLVLVVLIVIFILSKLF